MWLLLMAALAILLALDLQMPVAEANPIAAVAPENSWSLISQVRMMCC